MRVILFILIGLIIVSPNTINAQKTTSVQNPCIKIKSSLPAHYIEQDSIVGEMVILRLHNNLSCSIMIETDYSPTRVTITPKKGITIEAIGNDLRDGDILPLHYFVQDKDEKGGTQRGYQWDHMIYIFDVEPGMSIRFRVPIKTFKNKLDILVPFAYEWDDAGGIGDKGNTIHFIYFLNESFQAI